MKKENAMAECKYRSISENSDERLPRYFASCELMEDPDGDSGVVVDTGDERGMAFHVCGQCAVPRTASEELIPMEVSISDGFVMVRWYDLKQKRLLSYAESALVEGEVV
jgi:hypothetical protein